MAGSRSSLGDFFGGDDGQSSSFASLLPFSAGSPFGDMTFSDGEYSSSSSSDNDSLFHDDDSVISDLRQDDDSTSSEDEILSSEEEDSQQEDEEDLNYDIFGQPDEDDENSLMENSRYSSDFLNLIHERRRLGGDGIGEWGYGSENLEEQMARLRKENSSYFYNHVENRGDITEIIHLIDDVSEIPFLANKYLSPIQNSFSVAAMLGLFLRSKRTGQLRLFYASSNTIIGHPQKVKFIRRASQLKRYISNLGTFDYNRLTLRNEESDLHFHRVAYLRFMVLNYPNIMMKNCSSEMKDDDLPSFLVKSKNVITPEPRIISSISQVFKNLCRVKLGINLATPLIYEQCFANSCFFLALVLSMHNFSAEQLRRQVVLVKVASQLFRMMLKWFASKWVKSTGRIGDKKVLLNSLQNFEGISFDTDVEHLEQLFNLRINIFSLVGNSPPSPGTFDGRPSLRRKVLKLSPVYISSVDNIKAQSLNVHSVNILVVKSHALLIRNIERLQSQYICPNCDNIYSSRQTLTNHLAIKRQNVGNRWMFKLGEKEGDGCQENNENEEESVKIQHSGGEWKARSNIFYKIKSDFPYVMGSRLETSPADFDLDHIVCWDSEAFSVYHDEEKGLKTFGKSQNSLLTFTPFLITCATNIPGYDKQVFKFWSKGMEHSDVKSMVISFFSFLKKISLVSSRIYKSKLDWLFKSLKLIVNLNGREGKIGKLALRHLYNLNHYINQLPCLAFNLSYDIRSMHDLFCQTLLQYAEYRQTKKGDRKLIMPSIIARGGKYMCMSNSWFKFCDVMNYLGVPMSLGAFLDNINAKSKKLKIPYSAISCFDDLEAIGLPHWSSSAWLSPLKGNKTLLGDEKWEKYSLLVESEPDLSESTILKKLSLKQRPTSPQEDWENLCKIYSEYGAVTMRDIVQVYAEMDTLPLLDGCLKLAVEYRKMVPECVLYRDYISLPSLALKMFSDHLCSQNGSASTNLYVPGVELYQLIRENIVGGISVCMVREAIKDVTPIKGHIYGANALLTKYSTIFDVCALYGHAMKHLETSGPAFVRRKSTGFVAEFEDEGLRRNFWAEVIGRFAASLVNATAIRTRLSGGEVYVSHSGRQYRVDVVLTLPTGQSLAIEVYGDAHYCPWHEPFESLDDIHRLHKISNREVAMRDAERIRWLKREFDFVRIIWVCHFRNHIVQSDRFKEFYSTFYHVSTYQSRLLSQRRFSQSQIINEIMSKRMVGLVLASWTTPEELRSKFDNFPILLKRVFMDRTKIDPYSRKFCEKHGLLTSRRKELIQTFSVENQLISTQLFRFYIEMGLVCTNVSTFYEYGSTDAPTSLVDEVMRLRKAAAASGCEDAIGYSKRFKALNNLTYGSLLRNDAKNTSLTFSFNENYELYRKRNRLIGADYLGNFSSSADVSHGSDLYLLNEKVSKIKYDIPIQLGLDILCASKVVLFTFIYKFLACFNPRAYVITMADTDSCGVSFAASSLAEMEARFLIPSLRKVYYELKTRLLWDPSDKDGRYVTGKMIDEYYPQGFSCGLFLASKCYVLAIKDHELDTLFLLKCAVKGWTAAQRQNCSIEDYKRVLADKSRHNVFLYQMRYLSGKIHILYFQKTVLSFLNIKRFWHSNNINSRALDL